MSPSHPIHQKSSEHNKTMLSWQLPHLLPKKIKPLPNLLLSLLPGLLLKITTNIHLSHGLFNPRRPSGCPMADSGAHTVSPLNLVFTVKEFNMFVNDLLTGNSLPYVVSSTPDTEPSGEAETSSTTNLMSAYLNLPHHLKSCLDYCYFVLYNSYIKEKHRLGSLLLAEGLVKQDNSSTLNEDIASTVIDQLISLGMLDEDFDGLQQLNIPSSYKELGIGKGDTKNLLAKTPDSSIRLIITERGIDDLYPNLSGFSTTSLFDLRYWHNNCKPQAYMKAICKLKSLVVLVLDGDIVCLPDEIGDLVHLKNLSLTYRKLEDIPGNSYVKFQINGFTMVFSHMDELPVEELDIQRLWHLMINRNTINFKAGVPLKIGLRLNLHTLTTIYPRGEILSELSKFTQLRRLHIMSLSHEHATQLCAAIMNMTHLISLSMSMEGEPWEFVIFPELEAFSPPSRLQEVSLWGQLVDIPTWLLSMENLSHLFLHNSYIHDDSISLLQFLPNLKYLSLIDAWKAKQVGEEFCRAGGFPKLKMLHICSEFLVEWSEIAYGAFLSLRYLSFACKKLMFFPQGLQNIKTLDRLIISPIHGDLERRLQGNENYKIRNIPNVVFHSG